MNLDLEDKLIVITGGASGIGAAITEALLAEGARVVILSRSTPEVEAFITRIAPTRCEWIELDLIDTNRCAEAIRDIEARHLRIDALVNNAAVNDMIGLESGDPARFLQSLHANLIHYYVLAHYALPALKRSRGSILNIASKVAVTGQGGTSGYAASKGAQLALTREWAAELLPFGIRVNAILPAEVMTPSYRSWLALLGDSEARLDKITAEIPLGHRMTTPAEIAATAVFLLSPTQSAHTTGQHLSIDGGYVHLDRALT